MMIVTPRWKIQPMLTRQPVADFRPLLPPRRFPANGDNGGGQSHRGTRDVLFSALVLVAAFCASAPTSSAAENPAKTPLPAIGIAADGRSFVCRDGRPFVPMGVNYYRPGTGWAPQVWKKFDAQATRQDFARMKALGVNCVRVFLSYGSFFMQPDELLPDGLTKFDQFLAIAEEAGIYVHPTGLDHWEGLPPWAARDRIADPQALAVLEVFWKKFAQRYRGRSVIFAYDLRNEPEVAWDNAVMRTRWNKPVPEVKEGVDDKQLLAYQQFREDVADEWTRRQVAAIKSVDPQALVTVGLIQWSVPVVCGVRQYAAFRPARQAKLLDFLEMHFYPLAAGFYEYSGEEAEQRNLAYLECVMREAAAPGKPVVLAEFGWYGGQLTIDGGRHPVSTGEQQARWCRRAVETTKGLAVGWLNWGFFDHPEARDVSQLTGLLTSNGEMKAWGREFQKLAAGFSGRTIPMRQLGPRPTLDWDRAITSNAAGRQFLEEYVKAYRAAPRSLAP